MVVLLDELHLVIQEGFLHEVKWASLWAEPRACRFTAGPDSGFPLGSRSLPWHQDCDPTHLEVASACPRRRLSHSPNFEFSRDVWHPCVFPVPLASHTFAVGMEAQRERCTGSPQMQLTRWVVAALTFLE